MRFVSVSSFDSWRDAARKELQQGSSPEELSFCGSSSQKLLFGDDSESQPSTSAPPVSRTMFRLPRRYLEVARRVACHRDESRFDLLYRVLWRLTHGEPKLLEVTTDQDVSRLTLMDQAVRRDAHKMKAFVRFRRIDDESGEHYVAWHQPDHRVLQLTAPFFSRRFSDMHWTIFTPHESATWDLEKLSHGEGIPRSHVPQVDELDDLWRTYYASIFNPARVKVKAMVREMPTRYWHTMPETELIPDLLRQASGRVEQMIAPLTGAPSAAAFLPLEPTLANLRTAAQTCRGCDLCEAATQTVFGEGNASARIMLVGEQPGDEEDRTGRPFVGPAGKVLQTAMDEAGIDRGQVYLTNTVKHFKFISQEKRRLHKKPNAREMAACTPWLHAEIEQVRPDVLVCLGATAAQALLGRTFRISTERGQFRSTDWCGNTLATYHPSAVLRAADEDHRSAIYRHLVADLQTALGRTA